VYASDAPLSQSFCMQSNATVTRIAETSSGEPSMDRVPSRRECRGVLAAPGEVLAWSTAKDLVVGSGLEFEDRGEYELEGVPGRWRLFAVS
jgi:hypothetical protein